MKIRIYTETTVKVIAKDQWMKGKLDPTEYDAKNDAIRIRADYDYKKDEAGWLVHEQKHSELNAKGFKDDGKEYPSNSTEAEAYKAQFAYLKKKGYKFDDIFGIKTMEHKAKYKTILKTYWDSVSEIKEDKMDNVDLQAYYKKNEKFKDWIAKLKSFPEALQKEFVAELNDSKDEPNVYKKLVLVSKEPVSVKNKDLVSKASDVQNLSKEYLDIINKKWNVKWHDKNDPKKPPDDDQRYMKYAKMPASSAKPSIMIDGVLTFGKGRWIASLLRGDETIKVWELKTI